ncbi:MAG TPA: YggS family pyridoxal phosphate-dependent enzyme [Parachlamydiaceae bacterium]|nr:YggS family pyridoxal phosphate-dependent enzyme [Parachlamydiaceae bacterium]
MPKNSNYQKVCEEITAATIQCGRDPASVTLIAVTKQVDWPKASILYDQGQRNFGENRIEEVITKKTLAPSDCQFHFIGNLQKNKVRKVVGEFALIHSIDSFDLAEKLSAISQEKGIVTSILLQANTSGESSKNGYNLEEWKQCFEQVLTLQGVSVKGLMTMAPLIDDVEIIRECFRDLRKLRDELQLIAGARANLSVLSMGMSHDFKIAIEEGATMVRIGTALFSDS